MDQTAIVNGQRFVLYHNFVLYNRHTCSHMAGEQSHAVVNIRATDLEHTTGRREDFRTSSMAPIAVGS